MTSKYTQREPVAGTASSVLALAHLTRADVYDAFLLRADQVPEITAFLRARAPDAQRWLDAGCGTGRLSVGLREAGLAPEGLDLDVDYLDRARLRAPGVPLHAVDLTIARFDEPFEAVVLANGPLAYVLGEATLDAVLLRLHASLGSGSRLIADSPNFPWILENYQSPQVQRVRLNDVDIERHPRHHVQGDRFTHEDTVRVVRDGVVLGEYQESYTFAVRTAAEQLDALQRAGFVNVERWRDWTATDPDANPPGPRIVLSATRP